MRAMQSAPGPARSGAGDEDETSVTAVIGVVSDCARALADVDDSNADRRDAAGVFVA
jgi:hypothetical protein